MHKIVGSWGLEVGSRGGTLGKIWHSKVGNGFAFLVLCCNLLYKIGVWTSQATSTAIPYCVFRVLSFAFELYPRSVVLGTKNCSQCLPTSPFLEALLNIFIAQSNPSKKSHNLESFKFAWERSKMSLGKGKSSPREVHSSPWEGKSSTAIEVIDLVVLGGRARREGRWCTKELHNDAHFQSYHQGEGEGPHWF